MKVFVAGATGAIGKQLVPRLIAAGHEVVGTARRPSKEAELEALGATPAVLDALDRDAVVRAVTAAHPDAIVHELTAIGELDFRHFDRSFSQTNRLRTEGTDNLLAAARAAGVPRFVAQSYWGFFARVGGPVKTEEDPVDKDPPREMRETVAAIRHLEAAVMGADWTEGIVLRYGGFYGPATSLAPGTGQLEMIRKGKFPVLGGGGGVWSFLHVADGAQATVAALERGRRGIYNIVDDDPAPVAVWLPELSRQLGARKPWKMPKFVGRLLLGEVGTVMMTEARGASNAKAKHELGWQPEHASWREGIVG
ncbi:MAG: NAD(P)-dependent oxidoreductase [Solirubrobacteraceae bacterium]